MTKRICFDEEDKRYFPFVWNIPGGGMQFGETPKTTLIRETREELKVELKDIVQVTKVFTDVRDYWQGIFIIFLSRLKDPQAKIILNEEASEYAWVTLEEARKMKTMPKTIDMLEEADKINF